MAFVCVNTAYSLVKMRRYHQRKALNYCQKYHHTENEKRKEVYLKLCIMHSLKQEQLDKDEKSF